MRYYRYKCETIESNNHLRWVGVATIIERPKVYRYIHTLFFCVNPLVFRRKKNFGNL